MATRTAKSTRQNRLRLILAGTKQHFPNVTTVTLGGVAYPLTDLEKLLQTDIDASDASVQAKAAWRTAVDTERASHTKVNPVLRLFKFWVIAQVGDAPNASDTLADFGWQPRKSTKKTVATKAEAVAKTKATRAERHTMGAKQRAKVKGTVPAQEPTGTTPPAPAPGTGSAPSAPPAGGTTPPKPATSPTS